MLQLQHSIAYFLGYFSFGVLVCIEFLRQTFVKKLPFFVGPTFGIPCSFLNIWFIIDIYGNDEVQQLIISVYFLRLSFTFRYKFPEGYDHRDMVSILKK